MAQALESLRLTVARRWATFSAERAERRHRRRVFNRTYNELDAMTSRDLADLGIHRSEIGQVARQAAYDEA